MDLKGHRVDLKGYRVEVHLIQASGVSLLRGVSSGRKWGTGQGGEKRGRGAMGVECTLAVIGTGGPVAEGWAALERRAHGQEAAEAERDALAKLARKLEDRVREKDALVARALEESQATLEDARAMGHRVKELEGEAAERLADAEEAARRESRALQEQE
eukprot:1191243-Prorocentrum_minimum.AAC.3